MSVKDHAPVGGDGNWVEWAERGSGFFFSYVFACSCFILVFFWAAGVQIACERWGAQMHQAPLLVWSGQRDSQIGSSGAVVVARSDRA